MPGTRPGHDVKYRNFAVKSRFPGSMLSHRPGMTSSLLGGRRHLRIGRLWGVGSRRIGSLVHALDLCRLAKLGDVFGLRLAGHIGFDLRLDLREVGSLAV